ncbi:ATPase, partial [human gut metagenome]
RFVIQRDGQLIPIEVKSADNTRAKSLKVYMDTYKPAYAIKLSAKNFAFEDNKKVGSALCGVLYLNRGHTDKNSGTALLIEISVMWFFFA